MHGLLHDPRSAARHEPPPVARDAPDEWNESLAMALHDLGNAMSVVHGTVQLWRLGVRLHASPAEDWASVHAASGRAVRLSRELLDMCRVGHSRFRLDRRPVELVGLVVGVSTAAGRRSRRPACGSGPRRPTSWSGSRPTATGSSGCWTTCSTTRPSTRPPAGT
jgi:hypothetical protein